MPSQTPKELMPVFDPASCRGQTRVSAFSQIHPYIYKVYPCRNVALIIYAAIRTSALKWARKHQPNNMKKTILAALLLFTALTAGAQDVAAQIQNAPAQRTATLRFGYFSYQDVLQSTPDYAGIQRNIESLRNNFQAEMKRATDEFNLKYEAFLDGLKDFAPAIRMKRQAELQELMEKNMAFKQEAARLLQKAEAEALAPLKARLNQAIAKVGEQKGLAFILNTDNNAAPYLNPALGENVSAAISAELK